MLKSTTNFFCINAIKYCWIIYVITSQSFFTKLILVLSYLFQFQHKSSLPFLEMDLQVFSLHYQATLDRSLLLSICSRLVLPLAFHMCIHLFWSLNQLSLLISRKGLTHLLTQNLHKDLGQFPAKKKINGNLNLTFDIELGNTKF